MYQSALCISVRCGSFYKKSVQAIHNSHLLTLLGDFAQAYPTVLVRKTVQGKDAWFLIGLLPICPVHGRLTMRQADDHFNECGRVHDD
jgi:hypothetical protein